MLSHQGIYIISNRLSACYICSLRAFCALYYFEFYFLSFFQSLVAFSLDCGEMYKYIIFAGYGNKAEAFFCVEPFYCTFFHCKSSYLNR